MNTHKTLKYKEIDVLVLKLLSCVGRVDLEKPFSPSCAGRDCPKTTLFLRQMADKPFVSSANSGW